MHARSCVLTLILAIGVMWPSSSSAATIKDITPEWQQAVGLYLPQGTRFRVLSFPEGTANSAQVEILCIPRCGIYRLRIGQEIELSDSGNVRWRVVDAAQAKVEVRSPPKDAPFKILSKTWNLGSHTEAVKAGTRLRIVRLRVQDEGQDDDVHETVVIECKPTCGKLRLAGPGDSVSIPFDATITASIGNYGEATLIVSVPNVVQPSKIVPATPEPWAEEVVDVRFYNVTDEVIGIGVIQFQNYDQACKRQTVKVVKPDTSVRLVMCTDPKTETLRFGFMAEDRYQTDYHLFKVDGGFEISRAKDRPQETRYQTWSAENDLEKKVRAALSRGIGSSEPNPPGSRSGPRVGIVLDGIQDSKCPGAGQIARLKNPTRVRQEITVEIRTETGIERWDTRRTYTLSAGAEENLGCTTADTRPYPTRMYFTVVGTSH